MVHLSTTFSNFILACLGEKSLPPALGGWFCLIKSYGNVHEKESYLIYVLWTELKATYLLLLTGIALSILGSHFEGILLIETCQASLSPKMAEGRMQAPGTLVISIRLHQHLYVSCISSICLVFSVDSAILFPPRWSNSSQKYWNSDQNENAVFNLK